MNVGPLLFLRLLRLHAKVRHSVNRLRAGTRPSNEPKNKSPREYTAWENHAGFLTIVVETDPPLNHLG
jgi:hypothetical protein